MGVFKTSRLFYSSPALIDPVASDVVAALKTEDYEVVSQTLLTGGIDISITKGGTFTAILGMKTALKVKIVPQEGRIFAEAGVGLFGQQAIPTVISMFFLWPVLIPQIWGLVQQSNLDDHVIELIEQGIARHESKIEKVTLPTCASCGTVVKAGAKFCNSCGVQIQC